MAPVPPFITAALSRRYSDPHDRYISEDELSPLELKVGGIPDRHMKREEPVAAHGSASEDAIRTIAARNPSTGMSDMGTQAVSSTNSSPGAGSVSPASFNNAGILALFAIIGASMVVASLWFFFWAKNGGFHFQKGDWDDYKSTVLRRKGPDGKTLSNATKSTKLGGGTIAGSQHLKSERLLARSVVGRDEKGRKGITAKRGWAKTHSVMYSDDYLTHSFGTETVADEMTELQSEPESPVHHSKRYRDRDVQQYKRERPARVGGLNRVADSSHYDYTNTDRSEITDAVTESSERSILPRQSSRDKEKARAERKARAEAAKMERRWKKEAEEAAAALARETAARPVPSPAPAKQRRDSRSASPKKAQRIPSRDFSHPHPPAPSVGYTDTVSGSRTPSYYDEYRPRAGETPARSTDQLNRSRQSSPRKKPQGRAGASGGGYRRGMDSELD